MSDFKQRFGEENSNGEYVFSNVRNGLIVGLVGSPIIHSFDPHIIQGEAIQEQKNQV